MSEQAASTCSRSGWIRPVGGLWATNVRTWSGCLATRARPLTTPPLLSNRSTAPTPSASISLCRSSVLVRRGLPGDVGTDTAPDTARVVGHHRSVGKVRRERGEAAGVHRRSDQQQHAVICSTVVEVAPDVVVKRCPGRLQRAGCKIGHGWLPRVLAYTLGPADRRSRGSSSVEAPVPATGLSAVSHGIADRDDGGLRDAPAAISEVEDESKGCLDAP